MQFTYTVEEGWCRGDVRQEALRARFLLLFASQLTSDETLDYEDFAPTFARGDLQLIAEREYWHSEDTKEHLQQAMQSLRFVHA
jgi:hypothetical protein